MYVGTWRKENVDVGAWRKENENVDIFTVKMHDEQRS